jgi:type III secretion system low calcium response chaperone LcrH/SycD
MQKDKPNLEELVDDRVPPLKFNNETKELAFMVAEGSLSPSMMASEAQLEEFYERGCNLYNTGSYKGALPYFNLLNVSNPKDPRFLMAIAACYHMLKDYKKASEMYSFCIMVDTQRKSPYPCYHLSDCLMKLEEPLGAMIYLTMALERCNGPKFQALKDRVSMMITSLDKELLERKAQGLPLTKAKAA